MYRKLERSIVMPGGQSPHQGNGESERKMTVRIDGDDSAVNEELTEVDTTEQVKRDQRFEFTAESLLDKEEPRRY